MNNRLIKTALRNISRNKRRSILSAVAIGVAAMSIVFLFAIIAGMSDDMAANLKTYYTGSIQIKHKDYEEFERYNPIHLTIDKEAISKIVASNPDVDAWVPRNTFPSSIYIGGANFGAIGVGADFEMEKGFQDFTEIVKEGRLPENGKNEMLMGAVLAKDLKLKLGDKVTIISTTAARGNNAITLEIVGLAGFPVGNLNSSYFWIPLDRSQYFLRMDGHVQNILVNVKADVDERKVAAALTAAIKAETGVEVDARSWEDLSTTYGLIKMAQAAYNIMAFVFFLLGSTVIINTTMMVIFERMREIGTLGALGMHGKELVRLFFLEGAFISAIGSFIGVVLGVAGVMVLSRVGIDFTDAMSGMDFEISSILYPRLRWITVLIVFIYSVVVASLATLIPSRKAAKIQPVEALRYI
ncbi:MAG: ABC transporter permease [Spirochaetales bacterium]|nr:ABC transporter permease [Spirochaetales bacterium]